MNSIFSVKFALRASEVVRCAHREVLRLRRKVKLRQYRTIRVRVLARDFCACFREARFDPLHALRRIFLRRFPRRKLAISLILLRFLSENRQRNLSPYCAQGSSGASLEKSQENRRYMQIGRAGFRLICARISFFAAVQLDYL